MNTKHQVDKHVWRPEVNSQALQRSRRHCQMGPVSAAVATIRKCYMDEQAACWHKQCRPGRAGRRQQRAMHNKRPPTTHLHQLLRDGPRQAEPIVCGRPAPQLIHDHQRPAGCALRMTSHSLRHLLQARQRTAMPLQGYKCAAFRVESAQGGHSPSKDGSTLRKGHGRL
jgi:hypothetical protein